MTIWIGKAIEELTGFKQPAAQKRRLASLGITPIVRADGSLAVTEQAVTQAMLSGTKKRAVEPNWEAINLKRGSR